MGVIGICIGILATLGLMALGIFLSLDAAQLNNKTITIFNCSVVSASEVKEYIDEYNDYYYREVTVMINNQSYTDPLAYCPDETCNYFNKTAYCFWDDPGNIVVNYDFSRAVYYSGDLSSNDLATEIVVIMVLFGASIALLIFVSISIYEECRGPVYIPFRNNQYRRIN